MSYVYHGSKTHGLTELEPRPSTHGTYVYATDDKSVAIIMSKRCGDDATYSLSRNEKGGYDLVERIPGAFDKMFSNDFSLYTLDASTFKNIDTGFNEVVSTEPVKVEKEEQYPRLIDAIDKLVDAGLVDIYYYPYRPSYIPNDDMDLVQKIRETYIKKLHKQYNEREIARWIFLHPNLETEFRNIGKEQNIEAASYEIIRDMFTASQARNPEHECYIDNAESIYNLYKNNKSKLEINGFTLESFDYSNSKHIHLLRQMEKMEDVNLISSNIEAFIKKNILLNQKDSISNAFAINYNGELIGLAFINYHEKEEDLPEEIEVGLGILPEFRNLHLGTEIEKNLCDKLLEQHPNLNYIVGRIDQDNSNSIKAANRAGFEHIKDDEYHYKRLMK